MAQILNLELESKAAQVREFLSGAVREYGRVVYANSLGAEAMVLTDIICTSLPQIDIVSIDTGRLHEESYELLAKLQRRYDNKIRVIYPDGQDVSDLVTRQGINGFFDSPEARGACCGVRKVVPFKKFVGGYAAWVTGVRREQSKTRARGRGHRVGYPERSVQDQSAAGVDRRADLGLHPGTQAALQQPA
ncbi:MAG: phosphoadenosine phosphosulfate reductase family protein [Steroidobacteraceae bacterium]